MIWSQNNIDQKNWFNNHSFFEWVIGYLTEGTQSFERRHCREVPTYLKNKFKKIYISI